MIESLKSFYEKYKKINESLIDPEVLKSPEMVIKYSKELSEVEKPAKLYEEYLKVLNEIDELRSLDSPDLHEEILKEIKEKEDTISKLEKEAGDFLDSLDSNFSRNVIVEIRAGVGGQESAIFAGDLLRMYLRYAERHGLEAEILDSHETELGGFKEVTFSISGNGAYKLFKYESGVHRVQRVPVTEASGRIHTSTATVAVLPEATEVDIEINPDDLRIDTFRSSGAGGQHVNRTESAVRITHIPTGTVVVCESERSQVQNRVIAMKILRAKLFEMKKREEEEKMSDMRRNQIGMGERSEKIRTYNFPQKRVTDHRNGFTAYNLEEVMDGYLDEIVKSLIEWESQLTVKG
ncbi:MAG: peptide chain release factor 1 [Mesoaciditoga sp.]|uniref:peptide chain release factor 1 n=1 Tax=Athalassotoga sp. TaxID=2022597 RepID=UPI000CC7AE83|nr:MAG: peptide chain release factor 1 [Mesoaciditoga sp.]HEU24428.1 peptide chain release factor 1 [Mesoaciditoga lauensis]